MTVAVDATTDAAILPATKSPSLGVCLAFGIGTVGTAVLLNTVTVYLPAFMATVLGQSVALAGGLLTFSKLYDVVCDIVIGMASDRTQSRLGRRRPYMLAGALVGSLAFCLIFDPPFAGQHTLVWEMGALLILYSTGYSLFNVPYLALPPELAGGYHGRTRLLSFRTVCVSVGQFIALSASGWILHEAGGGRPAYAIMGFTLAAVILLTELSTVFGLHGSTAAVVKGPSVGESIKSLGSLFYNRQLCLLMASKFLQLISISISFSTSLLFMLNIVGSGFLGQANLSLAQNIAIALSMPVWLKISHRLGKRLTAIIAIGIYAMATLSWLLAGHGESTAGIVARGMVLGFGAGGIVLMASSMLPDVMEYDHLKTGLLREGVFSSCFAIVEKTAFALGPGLIGAYLSYAGYIPSFGGHIVVQPTNVLTALYVATAILPALTIAASVVFLLFYQLDEAKLLEMRRQAK
jgi:GPH family glycoside/pentoside/hexuronide:cation symporter